MNCHELQWPLFLLFANSLIMTSVFSENLISVTGIHNDVKLFDEWDDVTFIVKSTCSQVSCLTNLHGS